ncbi:MAG: hypothetical protein U1E53_23930 [Dongiaceae bacterium]
MKLRAAILLLAAALAACAQPVVTPRLASTQPKLRTARHWHEMASAVADQLAARLKLIKDASASGHLVDGTAPVATLAARPIYVRPLDPGMPFSDAFHDYLVLQLMVRGFTVATQPAGATVVNYDVQLLAYDHGAPWGYPYVPGGVPAVTAMGVGVAAGVAASPAVGALAAAGAADVVLTAAKVLGDQPNTEVIVTTEVVDEHAYVFRNVETFYIEDEDAALYAASYNGKPARPLPTGPSIPAPISARTLRVSTQ